MKKLNEYIGESYETRGKNSKIYIVTDIITCRNSKDEIVNQYFISYTDDFVHRLYDYNTPVSTVIRGLITDKKEGLNE